MMEGILLSRPSNTNQGKASLEVLKTLLPEVEPIYIDTVTIFQKSGS